jgi:hypothetical protein
MSDQPVPDGMVMIDGKLVKKAKLSKQQHIENWLIYHYVTFWYFLKSIYWYWKLALIQWRKRKALPQFPVVLELFGDDPTTCFDVLKSYGVYATGGSIQWKVIWNTVNLRLLILVAKSQYEFADNILAQTSGDKYQITDGPGPKRGQALPRSYA